jgi:hypothetical protein
LRRGRSVKINTIAKINIPLDNPIGVAVIAILLAVASVGVFFWVLSSLMDYIILPILRVPKDRRGSHPFNRAVSILTLLLGVALLLLFVLPACGVKVLPFTIEDIIPIGILGD